MANESMIQKIKNLLVGTRVGALLHRTGIARACYAIHDWPILRRGYYGVEIQGQHIRLSVPSSDAIRRVEWIVDNWPRLERQFIGRLLNAIQPEDICFDVGANIGVVTLLMAISHRDRNVTVQAFEPEPGTSAALRANIELNGMENAHANEVAFGDKPGQMQLFANPAFGSGQHSMVNVHASEGRSVPIHVVTGDEWIRKSQCCPDVIKIDVEGAEMMVLEGMKDVFGTRQVRELFIEVHPDMLAQCGSSSDQVHDWLEQRQYRLVWSEDRGTQFHEHYRRE